MSEDGTTARGGPSRVAMLRRALRRLQHPPPLPRPGTAELALALGAVRRWPPVIWAVLVVGAVALRPPLAPLETATLSVAWQAWVPGFADPDALARPPLLVWLIHVLWSLFGVSETLARLVVPAFALAAVLLVQPLARLLWPDRPQLPGLASLTLVGTGGLAVYLGFAIEAVPPVFFLVIGLLGVAKAWRGEGFAGWSLFGTAVLFGCLSGGWLFLLALLPSALLGPLWSGTRSLRPWHWVIWYARAAGAASLGVALVFAWMAAGRMDALTALGGAVPAAPDAVEIGRRAWYWSLAAIPLVFYPWIWWRTLWRRLAALRRGGLDAGLRFTLLALLAGLATALATGSGQADALLPMLPAFALLVARCAADEAQPGEFHALLPGSLALFIGLIAFLLNIVPLAHLDAVWRELVDPRNSLPIWLGGISLVPGLMLLGGGYLLAQMTPREMRSGVVQLALLPALLVTCLNLEFLFSIGRFFDLDPIAERVHLLQEEGRPVAFFGRYDGELDLAGRLRTPLVELRTPTDALFWAAANPDGVVVSTFQGSILHLPARPLDDEPRPAGDRWAALWPARVVLSTDAAVLQPRF